MAVQPDPNQQASIQESEFLNTILESVDDGIVACNAQGELTLFNKATRRFHGLPEKAMPVDDLANYYDLYLADGVSKMTAQDIPILRALNGEIIENVEMVIAPKNGSKRTVLANGRALKDSNNKTIGAVIAMHDITERKEAEQKVFQTQAQLLKAQEIAKLGYWEWQLETDTLYWTDRLYDIYEIDPNEALSYELFINAIHPQDRSLVETSIQNALATSRPFEHFHRTLLKDGSIRYINGIGETISDKTGKINKMVGVAIDITQATLATKALEEATARFSATFQSSTLGMAIASPEGNWLELNEAFCKSLAYDCSELLGKSYADITHPDDLANDHALLKRLLSGELKNCQYEKRFVRSDGSTMHAFMDVSSLFVEDNLAYYICSILDISEFQKTRSELAESERRFKAIFEAQPSAIIYTDHEGRIEETNSSIDFLFGYAERELIGRKIWVLYQNTINHSDLLAKARQEKDNTLWQAEVPCLHKKGYEISCELTGRVLDEGNTESQIWVFQDVSERKKAQERLQELNEKLARSREEERLHISREIHDQSIQDLIGVNYGLAALQRQLKAGEDINIQESIQSLRGDIVSAIKQLRGIISELRPAALEEFGFEAALEGFISKLERNRQEDVPEVVLSIDAKVDTLPQPLLICFFRAAQEALNNMIKHAKASKARVTLKIFEHEALMVIEDDGVGFEVPQQLDKLTNEQHFGLTGIEERVKLMQGQLMLRSHLGVGTEISLTIPLTTQPPDISMEG